jgi:hypothetical protein|uniref:Uncharacterized protein n=1 Tax=viral metagenome TaxID=1070528 RepID=A0A6C0IAR0_9ZZZZ
MNIKCIAYLVIASNYINHSNGFDKQTITRCNSAPDLRLLCNATMYATAAATPYTNTYNMNNIISYEQYKLNIYNKKKRNMYLRSKERYSFDAKK